MNIFHGTAGWFIARLPARRTAPRTLALIHRIISENGGTAVITFRRNFRDATYSGRSRATFVKLSTFETRQESQRDSLPPRDGASTGFAAGAEIARPFRAGTRREEWLRGNSKLFESEAQASRSARNARRRSPPRLKAFRGRGKCAARGGGLDVG